MWLDGERWFLLISGLLFATFGGLAFFNDRFFGTMRRTLWKQTTVLDKIMFPSGGYLFDRYGRGLGALIFGVGLLWFLIQSLSK
jgi:hypothetical protein